MMRAESRIRFWAAGILVVNFLYILFEFSFNAQLVDAASNIYVEAIQLHDLELVGRILSGIGLGLAITGWLKLYRYTKLTALASLTLVFGLSIPFMYHLQASLINYLVEEHFDTQARQTAQYAMLLKSGIEHDTLVLSEVAFDPKHRDSPEQKTFLAMVGAVVFNSESVINQLRENRHEIVKRYIYNYIVDHEEDYWDRYQQAYTVLHGLWERYQAASQNYVNAVNTIDKDIDRVWAELEGQLEHGWKTYSEARRQFEKHASQGIDAVADQLDKYFTARADCSFDECRRRYDANYRKQIRTHFGRFIAPEFWLTERTQEWVERNCGGEIKHSACESSLGEMLNPFNWFAIENQLVWDRSVSALLPKLMLAREDEFIQRSGGYGISISSYEAFVAHRITAEHVRHTLQGKGIILPPDWRVARNRDFTIAVAQKVREQIDQQWQSSVQAQLGEVIAPNLSYDEFIRSAYVDKRIRSQLGNNYIEGIRPDYGREAFFDQLLIPLVDRYTQRMLQQLDANLSEFSDSGRYAGQAKQYIRALVIPPVAMFFSLLFGLVAVAKLPALVLSVYQAWRETVVIGRLLRFKVGFFCLAIAIILVFPMFLIENRFSHPRSGFQLMLNESKSNRPLIGHAMEWVIRIQPVAYPVGAKLGLVDWVIESKR